MVIPSTGKATEQLEFSCCWWEGKTGQPVWKMDEQSLIKVSTCSEAHPAIPHREFSKGSGNVCAHRIHDGFIRTCPTLETTWLPLSWRTGG